MTQRDDPTPVGPIACDLSALGQVQRERRALLAKWFRLGTVHVQELPDGYAFRLDRVSFGAQHVREFMALEQRCCPFLRFQLRLDPEQTEPVLEVRGAPAVKPFVAAQFHIDPETRV